jgi:protein-tyrosine phosphatase
MGNICRSPTAEAVFRKIVEDSNFAQTNINIESAGTIGYHVGEPSDPRSVQAGRVRSYDLSKIRARKVIDRDFDEFDLLIAMDKENYTNLIKLAEQSGKIEHKNKVKLFLDYSSQTQYIEVPDPYYGGPNGFDLVIDLIEDASKGLLRAIIK